MSGGWSPVVHLWSHCGGKLRWNDAGGFFAPDPARPPVGADGAAFVVPAGAAAGLLPAAASLETGTAPAFVRGRDRAPGRRNRGAARRSGGGGGRGSDLADAARRPPGPRLQGVRRLPERCEGLGCRASPPARAIPRSSTPSATPRSAWRPTRGSSPTSTGSRCSPTRSASRSPSVGTTTFRPPYAPATLGALAGEARGPLFKPLRRSAARRLARRQRRALGAGRRLAAALLLPPARREHRRGGPPGSAEHARRASDSWTPRRSARSSSRAPTPAASSTASTPGMSSLAVGRCRYGLMCNENGFLFDDGVVVRLDRGRIPLPHDHRRLRPGPRLDGGVAADRVAGPAGLHRQPDRAVRPGRRRRPAQPHRARATGGIDVSAARRCRSCPRSRETLGGLPARVHRISFSGELSFEVAVPASRGRELWDALLAAGAGSRSSPTAPRRCTSCGRRRASS